MILRKPFAQRIAKKRVNETSVTSNRALRYILSRNYFEAICLQPFQFARCFTETITLLMNLLLLFASLTTCHAILEGTHWELISKRESKCETRLIPLTYFAFQNKLEGLHNNAILATVCEVLILTTSTIFKF